jgi:hypothetical protein
MEKGGKQTSLRKANEKRGGVGLGDEERGGIAVKAHRLIIEPLIQSSDAGLFGYGISLRCKNVSPTAHNKLLAHSHVECRESKKKACTHRVEFAAVCDGVPRADIVPHCRVLEQNIA